MDIQYHISLKIYVFGKIAKFFYLTQNWHCMGPIDPVCGQYIPHELSVFEGSGLEALMYFPVLIIVNLLFFLI